MSASGNSPQVDAQDLTIFPSLPLTLLSLASRFFTTTALISSSTQIEKSSRYFAIPTVIGFVATTLHHVHLQIDRPPQEYRKSSSPGNPITALTTIWITVSFILVPLWAAIFYFNLLSYFRQEVMGIGMTTIWSGLECMVILCIALYCTRQVGRMESSDTYAEDQNIVSNKAPMQLDVTVNTLKPARFVYFASFVLCTSMMIFSIDHDITFNCLPTVLAFFLTAPHHIALYISHVRPHYRTCSILSRPTSVYYAFFLVTLWCGVLVSGIFFSHFAYRDLLLGFLAGVECIAVAYLAVFDNGPDGLVEGQIKLYEDEKVLLPK